MTWTYSADPASSDKDTVRFYVGDTIQADPQINDEEIAFLLGEEGDVIRAAARTAEAIAAKYARQVDKSVGGLSLSAGRRQEHYQTLAMQLWGRANSVGGGLSVPYAGGISVSDKDANAADGDRVDPIFYRTLQDYVSDQGPDIQGGDTL